MQRSNWEDKYGLGFQTAIDAPVVASEGVFLFDHFVFDYNMNILDKNKAKSTASKSYNVDVVNESTRPSLYVSTMFSPACLYPLLKLFFQRGALVDSNKEWFFPYSYESNGSSCNAWSSITKELANTGTTTSHRLSGMVGSNLNIQITSSEYIKVNSLLLGRKYENNIDSSGCTFTMPTDAPLLWKNAVTTIGDSFTATEVIDLKGFTLSVNNNAFPKFYNNEYTKHFTLGNVFGNGTIQIPWVNASTNFTGTSLLDNFVDGDLTRLSVYWKDQYLGTGHSVSINMLCRYNKATVINSNEVTNEHSFTLCEDWSYCSENSKISAWSVDSSSADTINLTMVGSNTLLGNVFPGDYLVTLDSSTLPNNRYKIKDVDSNTLTLTEDHAAGLSALGTSVAITRHPINFGINRV